MKKRRQVLAVTLAATMVMGMGLSTVSAYAKDKGGKTKITFTYRDDGSDQSVAPLYQWVTAAYDSWDKKDEVELDVAPITASEGDYFTKIALQLAVRAIPGWKLRSLLTREHARIWYARIHSSFQTMLRQDILQILQTM